jgi:hypothetical protein
MQRTHLLFTFATFACLACLPLAACGSTSPATSEVDGGGGGDAGGAGEGTDAGVEGADAGGGADTGAETGGGDRLQTVFLIMMENHSWPTLQTPSSAPYIGSLVSKGGHAENYNTTVHPSEANYIWLEAGDNLGIADDKDPSVNHRATKQHLSTLLDTAGVSWKVYAEGITAGTCPLTSSGHFVPRHVPQLFFDDVTNTNDPNALPCTQHIRPYSELATDMQKGTLPRYVFITPDLCDDMHSDVLSLSPCGLTDSQRITDGDTWLSTEVPKIQASAAYKNNGVLFILWDEGDEPTIGPAANGPIPLFVLSPKAKTNYASNTAFSHSSMLKTVQEILGVSPLLGGAASATDLAEFFTSFP